MTAACAVRAGLPLLCGSRRPLWAGLPGSVARALSASPAACKAPYHPRRRPRRRAKPGPVVDLNSALSRQGGEGTGTEDEPGSEAGGALQEVRGLRRAEVCFSGIAPHLSALIQQTPYVCGCMAWLTSQPILAALAACRGVSVVVTNDRILQLPQLRDAYDRLTPLSAGEAGAIRQLGDRAGRNRALMHHKFLVGLSAARTPQWVSLGSFNASNSADTNLETLVVLRSRRMAAVFLEEWRAVHAASLAIPARQARGKGQTTAG